MKEGYCSTPDETTVRHGAPNYPTEIRLGWVCLAFTVVAWLAISQETFAILMHRLALEAPAAIFEQGVFILIVQAMLYGSFVYQLCRLGYLYRRRVYRSTAEQARNRIHGMPSPPRLTILVPSYKEELSVVRRTLMSAILQDYPNRCVTLLLDDPPNPVGMQDRIDLAASRRLCPELQLMFDRAAEPFFKAREEFARRQAEGAIYPVVETALLSLQHQRAAMQIEGFAASFPKVDHSDLLLHERVFQPLVEAHRRRAQWLDECGPLDELAIAAEHERLANLFRVTLTSFERKRYANLSHEPNKAMNLNSYIGLLGRQWRVVRCTDGDHLVEGCGSIAPPASDFILTLDADSMLLPDYASILVDEMLCPGNERLAVAQTPYNAIPGCSSVLERTAGATTDIQYLIHQGFTHFGATYWVGANALLRMEALNDIRTEVEERGFKVPVFIQDRTVIEDTESSVDLVSRGWKLYNHPERLAFSATPSDFGALLIQRRRWANGGLIILPKLLRYLAGGRGRVAEGFFRIHYLTSIALVNVGFLILLAHSFQTSFSSAWLPLTAIPFFVLNARDLRYSGYKVRDMARIYALNLLLLPVNLGGVLKSLEQAITGKRIPFGRTPKVSGRTGVPALYVLAEYSLLALCLALAVYDIDQRLWNSALFHLGNGLFLGYAIWSFLGVRASIQDVRGAVESWNGRPGTNQGAADASLALTQREMAIHGLFNSTQARR